LSLVWFSFYFLWRSVISYWSYFWWRSSQRHLSSWAEK